MNFPQAPVPLSWNIQLYTSSFHFRQKRLMSWLMMFLHFLSLIIVIIFGVCGQRRHNTQLHAQKPLGFLGMDVLTTEHILICKATWVIDVFGLFLYMLAMGVCTTKHWKTPSRLVQEVNLGTVRMSSWTFNEWILLQWMIDYESTFCNSPEMLQSQEFSY